MNLISESRFASVRLRSTQSVSWFGQKEGRISQKGGKMGKTRGRRSTKQRSTRTYTSAPASQLTSVHGSDSRIQWHITQPISMTDNYEMTTCVLPLRSSISRLRTLAGYHYETPDSKAIRVLPKEANANALASRTQCLASTYYVVPLCLVLAL